ncbi:MAG: pyruvate dehydrogenase [Rubrivivax sp.]|nr:MAG: pyruvate dehydrogenase [Rubrivivax sp.]
MSLMSTLPADGLLADRLHTAYLIRAFEERLLLLYGQGKIRGTVHTCIGQEMIGVAAVAQHRTGDWYCSNHRGHGHYLALTGDYVGLFREIMGLQGGVSGGHGGSQHLYADGFISNGIQGGMMPIALGQALAHKLRGTDNLACLFMGDGTLGEGNVYEGLNIASKWNLPLLVVLENNGIAQSTPSSQTIAGEIADRPRAFGVHYLACDTWDIDGLMSTFAQAREIIRRERRPVFVEVRTGRLKSHSKGDDTRAAAEVDALWARDPLHQMRSTLTAQDPEYFDRIEREIDHFLALALQQPAMTIAKARPLAEPATQWLALPRYGSYERIASLINQGFKALMAERDDIAFIGEDVMSPYGGAFKIAKDLSDLHPERVLSTPISEASIVGIGTGLALSGFQPLVEIMFGDFLTLGFDQLLNHATKFRSMYGRDLPVPVVVRAPMGGYRGYGPTHSQSIEKHFMGIPDLDVIALNQRVCPRSLYQAIYADLRQPTLVVENKVLYTEPLKQAPIPGYELQLTDERYPCLRIRPEADRPQLTIACYGYMLSLVEAALDIAFDEHEIVCEVICPTQIAPLRIEPMVASLRTTQRLLTVEEGVLTHGFGSEVIARCVEAGTPLLRCKKLGIAGIIPSSADAELQVLPSVQDIVNAIIEVASSD